MRKNPLNMIMTPFVVVDAKALTEYNGIVKNLVKSKKFIVLIPNAGKFLLKEEYKTKLIVIFI